MQITAALVKELRDRTGAGMMECKKALQASGGDVEAAIEEMRKSGLAKAAKKADRTAAEGTIVLKKDGGRAILVEVNCETDFVTKGEDFQNFANAVGELVLKEAPVDLEQLKSLPMAGEESVEETRQQLVAKIGENIGVRRFVVMEIGGTLGSYLHGTRIGVLVDLEGGDEALARDIAMHVAASRPQYLGMEDIPEEVLDKEREILSAQAAESGKPAEIIEKMVEGRLRKFVNEITLLGQPFVKDPDLTVGKLLEQAGAKVRDFARLEVGEGIEKKQENFAEEVKAQAKG